MQRMFLASVAIALAAVSAPGAVHAQGQQPTFATTKVTDNVYYFRYQGHQAMFIVTPAGVIATDPISENRPAAEAYLAERRKGAPDQCGDVVLGRKDAPSSYHLAVVVDDAVLEVTHVVLGVDYDFGVPTLAELIGPTLQRKVRENSEMMLAALKVQAEQAAR